MKSGEIALGLVFLVIALWFFGAIHWVVGGLMWIAENARDWF